MSYEEVWKSQPVKLAPIDFSRLVREARRFERVVMVRNWMEWIAVAFVVPLMALIAATPPMPLVSRISAGYLCLVASFVAVVLARYGRLRRLPDPAQSTHAFLAAQRRRLLSQATLLAWVPLWYIAPFAIGIAGVYAGVMLAAPVGLGRSLVRFAGPLAATILFLGFLAWNNRRASRKLREEAAKYTSE